MVVAGVGVLVRAPLSRVPENTLKFVVGILLTSFGVFWSAEGAGASWPAADLSLLVIVPVVAVVAVLMVFALRHRKRSADRASAVQEAPASGAATEPTDDVMTPTATVRPVGSVLRRRAGAIGFFVYDFVVGDDWRVAVAVVGALLLTAALSAVPLTAWWIIPIVVVAAMCGSSWQAARTT